MSQTIEGSKKTRATMIKKYGSEEKFIEQMKKIGAQGGKAKNPNKGFGSKTPEERRAAGAKGGAISKRGKSIDYELNFEDIHTKAETKKRVYSPSNTRVDSNSVSSPISKLSSAFNRVVRK